VELGLLVSFLLSIGDLVLTGGVWSFGPDWPNSGMFLLGIA
jgi:hypothetical protein